MKLTVCKKQFIKNALSTYSHMSYKELMKMFGVSTKIAKVNKTGIYFNIDPNMIGYVISDRITKEDDYNNMFGYNIKWETINDKLPMNTAQTFIYESSLLAISDIVILDMDNLYEELTSDKSKRKAQG